MGGLLVALVAALRSAPERGAEGRPKGPVPTSRRELESAIVDLSRILYHAAGAGRRATVSDELDFTARYLRLQSLRFGGRLAYRVTAEPRLLSLLIPRLSAFPLLERAASRTLELSAGPAFISVVAAIGANGQASMIVRSECPSGSEAESIRLPRPRRAAEAKAALLPLRYLG
jgi:hypothetical protein